MMVIVDLKSILRDFSSSEALQPLYNHITLKELIQLLTYDWYNPIEYIFLELESRTMETSVEFNLTNLEVYLENFLEIVDADINYQLQGLKDHGYAWFEFVTWVSPSAVLLRGSDASIY